MLTSGPFDFGGNLDNNAIHLRADIDVVGGGPGGSLGLQQTHAGWLNIINIDAPSQGFLRRHSSDVPPVDITTLRRVVWDIDFTAVGTLWTTVGGGPRADESAGERSFSVLVRQDWAIDGTWDIAIDGTATPVGSPTVSKSPPIDYAVPRRAEDRGIETHWPGSLDYLGYDDRN